MTGSWGSQSKFIQSARRAQQVAADALNKGNVQDAEASLKEAADGCNDALDQRARDGTPLRHSERMSSHQRIEVLRLRLRLELGSARCLAQRGQGGHALKAVQAGLERYARSAGRERCGPVIDLEVVMLRSEAHLALGQLRDAVKWFKVANLLLARVNEADLGPLKTQLGILHLKLRRDANMGVSCSSGNSAASLVVIPEPSRREKWRRRLLTTLSFAFVVGVVTIIVNLSLDDNEMSASLLLNLCALGETISLFILGWSLHAKRARRRLIGEDGCCRCPGVRKRFAGALVLRALDSFYALWCLVDASMWLFIAWYTKAYRIRNRRLDDLGVLLIRDIGCLLSALASPTRAMMASCTVRLPREAPEEGAAMLRPSGGQRGGLPAAPICLLDTLNGDQSEQMDHFVDEFNIRMEEDAFYNDFCEWWSRPNSSQVDPNGSDVHQSSIAGHSTHDPLDGTETGAASSTSRSSRELDSRRSTMASTNVGSESPESLENGINSVSK